MKWILNHNIYEIGNGEWKNQMNAYFLADFIIFGVTVIWRAMCNLPGKRKKDVTQSNFYLTVVLIILTIFIGLRGLFSTDAPNYEYAWNAANNASSLIILLKISSKDFGFTALMYVLGKVTSSVTVFFCFVAAVTVWGYLVLFKKYSPIVWLSVLVLVCVGPLYISMNLMRNVLTGALYCLAIKSAIEKSLPHYCVLVVCIATLHFSAMFMIPLYFVLNFKWNVKKNQIGILLGIIGVIGVLVLIFSDNLMRIALRYVSAYDYYSMNDSYVRSGLTLINVLKVFLIQGFILLNRKKINLKDSTDRCFFNASILYTLFYILAMNIAILQRFTFYFAFSHMILVPMIISRIHNTQKRTLMTAGMTMFLLAYAFVANYGKEYAWYWEYNL